MRFGSILSVRRAIANMSVQNEERGPAFCLPKNVEGMFNSSNVIGVTNPENIPPVSRKARRNIFGKGDACISFDRDVIVIVNPAEVIETR